MAWSLRLAFACYISYSKSAAIDGFSWSCGRGGQKVCWRQLPHCHAKRAPWLRVLISASRPAFSCQSASFLYIIDWGYLDLVKRMFHVEHFRKFRFFMSVACWIFTESAKWSHLFQLTIRPLYSPCVVLPFVTAMQAAVSHAAMKSDTAWQADEGLTLPQ